ncbi:MAG TPA: aldehyde dehydrogenase [Solirubrobacterales bacterium]|nr:aldehyde dehydrogenase [Solirubrobacterales bacterium]
MAVAVEQQQNLLIGGEWVGAKSGRECEQTNPYSGDVVGHAASAGPEDVDLAVKAADAAFEEWGFGPPAARRETLTKAADLMQERAEEIAAIVTEETGGTFGWGMFNVQLASGMMREAGAQAYSVVGEVIPSDIPGAMAIARRQPAGVVVGIAPWNAPVILGTRALATPLAFGNTVILKGSELCPRTHAQIVRCVQDAGAPEGVVNYLTNDPDDAAEVVDALIAHPRTRRINFTGSTRVGKIIAENCGRHLKRCLLELGGKAPMIVMADADLDEAVNAANFGAFMHSGQICMATERIIVDSKVAGEFTDGLVAKASSLTVGDPSNPETMIGPLINKASLEHVSELVEDARSKGAEVKTGGEADGPCYKPTVLTKVTPEMRVYSEESFGPIVPVLEYSDLEDAIRTANDTRYGLAGAVFSRDIPTALDVAQRIESGICHVNNSTVHDEPQMPFGGVKESGWGRFGGSAALEEFTDIHWTMVMGQPREYPI